MVSQRRLAAVAAARAGVGTRFRPQGRIIGLGLDCVGVALLAAAGAGIKVDHLPAYALSGDHAAMLRDALRAIGCRRVRQARPGDVIEYALTPGHRHLAVQAGAGIIHAHAGLGRVVEGPAPAEWPVVACWALPGLR